jgi:hypothetical protein
LTLRSGNGKFLIPVGVVEVLQVMNATCSNQTWLRALAAAALATLWLACTGAAAQALKLEKLTEEQLGRLRKIALDQGSTIPVPPLLVGVLRLSAGQIAPSVRQVAFQGDDGAKHGFARLNDGSGYFFFRRSPAGLWAFHADPRLVLVVAARNFSTEQFIALSAKDGQEAFAAEMVAWSRVLSPRGVSLPAPGTHPAQQMTSPIPALPPPAEAVPGAVPAAPAH